MNRSPGQVVEYKAETRRIVADKKRRLAFLDRIAEREKAQGKTPPEPFKPLPKPEDQPDQAVGGNSQ